MKITSKSLLVGIALSVFFLRCELLNPIAQIEVGGAAPWIEGARDSAYTVHGDDIDGVCDDIYDPDNGKGILSEDESGEKERFAGAAYAHFEDTVRGPATFPDVMEGCSCVVTVDSIAMGMEKVVRYPKWADYAKGTKTDRANWDNFTKKLKRHEKGHFDIFDKGFKRMKENLNKKWKNEKVGAFGEDCKEAHKKAYDKLYEAIQKDLKAEKDKIKQEQDEYEKKEQHGPELSSW